VTGTLEHASLAVAEREDVAGSRQILGQRGGIDDRADRSAAEIPVVTPRRASMETVKAVLRRSVFEATIKGISRSSRRSPSTGMQITPLE
jgi:hypothetical protein